MAFALFAKRNVARYLNTLPATLQDRGVIVTDGERLKVTQDYTFDSPSTAAELLIGRTSNGRERWKDADGRTLKENQSASVDGQIVGS